MRTYETIVKVLEKKATGGPEYFIHLPKRIVNEMGLKKGDYLKLKFDGSKIVLKKAR